MTQNEIIARLEDLRLKYIARTKRESNLDTVDIADQAAIDIEDMNHDMITILYCLERLIDRFSV